MECYLFVHNKHKLVKDQFRLPIAIPIAIHGMKLNLATCGGECAEKHGQEVIGIPTGKAEGKTQRGSVFAKFVFFFRLTIFLKQL